MVEIGIAIGELLVRRRWHVVSLNCELCLLESFFYTTGINMSS